MGKAKAMVSACLVGINCRYDGKSQLRPELVECLRDYQLIPFCPEYLGELPTPRLPSEICNGDGAAVLAGAALVLNRQGDDWTPYFIKGAEATLRLYQEVRPDLIVFKAKSPSCGVGQIYDGTFTGKLRSGDGVTAALLRQKGACLYSETDILQNKPEK
ncbi:MAG TPA: DUF523 domain-containing protein [Bacillota bacterium]